MPAPVVGRREGPWLDGVSRGEARHVHPTRLEL